MKEIMEIMTQMMKKKDMFKKHSFNTFQCNPNDPNFDLFKFLMQNKFAHIKITQKECSK